MGEREGVRGEGGGRLGNVNFHFLHPLDGAYAREEVVAVEEEEVEDDEDVKGKGMQKGSQ